MADKTHACTAPDGGTSFTNTDPSGSVSCYRRRFNGTVYMAWFGVQSPTASNLNDVSLACPSPLSNCWTNAFNAAAIQGANFQGGNNTVSTGGMYLYTTGDINPQENQSFTCDSPNTGQASTSYTFGISTQVTGAILLGSPNTSTHAARVYINKANGDFHNCIVLTSGSAAPIVLDWTSCNSISGNTPASISACAFANTRNMVTNGDIGVYCDHAENTSIHDVLVIGFDTGIGSVGCSRFKVENAHIDADVGIYLQSNKAPAFISNVNVFPFMASGLTNDEKEYTYTITGVSHVGTNCVVTLSTAPPTGLMSAGDWVSVAGDGVPADDGLLSCHGTFQVATNVVGVPTVNLQGSTWGSPGVAFATRPSSWLLNSSIMNVNGTAGGVAGVEAGTCVTSSDFLVFTGYSSCGTKSVVVKDVSYYSNKIVIGQASGGTPTGNAFTKTTQPSTGPATLSFANPGPYVSGSLLRHYAGRRVAAGSSIGGIGTGHVATCIAGGGPGDTSPLGMVANNIFCFGHRVQYNFNSVGPAICTGCAFDTQSELFDMSQIGVRFGHGTDPLVLKGVVGGGSGCSSLNCIGTIQFGGTGYDPQLAGWSKGDVVIDASPGHITYSPPTTVSFPAGPPFTIQLSQPANPGGATTTIYDVRPLSVGGVSVFPTGDILPGALNVITNLNADPTTNWRVGDQIITPQNTGVLPYPGGRIVSMSSSPCTSSCYVTLDTNALAAGSALLLGDLSVTTPQATSSADFVGSNLGGGGGFVSDATGPFCNSVQGTTFKVNNPGQPSLESVNGCTLLTSVSTNQPNDVMVDAATTNFLLSGSQFARAGLYFEGQAVANIFSGTGNIIGASNVVGSGGQSNMTTFGDSSKCPTTSQSNLVVFCGGDANGITGNAYQTCNPAYPVPATSLAGCIGTSYDNMGTYKHTNSNNVPIYEFKDTLGSQALLPTNYEDGISARVKTDPAPSLIAATDVVSLCVHTSCSADGVFLPLSSGWVDAATQVSGSDCPTGYSRNCGVAGPITVINGTASGGGNTGTITIWCNTGDKLNNVLCSAGASATLGANQSMTFYPILGVGWVHN